MIQSQTEHVHEFAQYLHNRSNARGFVVYSASVEDIFQYYGRNTIFYFIKNSFSFFNRIKIKRAFPHAYFVNARSIEKDFLEDKIYLSLNATQKTPKHLLSLIDQYSLFALYCSDKAIGKNSLVGTFAGKNGITQYLNLSGKLARPQSEKLVSVLAIIPVYNEVDIVAHTVDHLIREGLDIHLIDDWSNDGTYELLQEIAAREPQRITVSRSPKATQGKHNWDKMLERISQTANTTPHDWVMFNDADELRISPWLDKNLRQAFSFVDATGFNAIDFTVFDYRPTKEGFGKNDTPQAFFSYGEFGTRPGHFIQVKAWKNSGQVDLAKSGGHNVDFAKRRIFPLKFLLQHYPLRSTAQAQKKLLKDRLPRLKKDLVKKGWHGHYLRQSQQESYIYAPRTLTKATPRNKFFERYFIQRLSGVGLQKDS